MKFPLSKNTVEAILLGELDLLDLPHASYSALYDYYLPEMPYGTAKARDGDPCEWIFHRLEEEFI